MPSDRGLAAAWTGALRLAAPDTLRRLAPPLFGVWLFLAARQLAHLLCGGFILPSPAQTARARAQALGSLAGSAALGATIGRVRLALGLAAGYAGLLRATLAPVATILLGMPAVAWVVLTMIWFGPSHGAILCTIAIVTGPVLYIGAADAAQTRDRRLEKMAASFGMGPLGQFRRVALRQIRASLGPVAGIALALGFKVAIMAALVANVSGLGVEMARTRAHMDIDAALANIALAVAGLVAVEHLAIRPFQRRSGAWKRIGA